MLSTKQEGTKLVLKFNADKNSKLDPSFVNFIRNILISEVKCHSLTKNLTIHSNTSVFNNEYVKNIVQLFPIQTDLIPKGTSEDDIFFYISDPDDIKKPLYNNNDEELLLTAHMFTLYDRIGNKLKNVKVEDLIKYNFPFLKLQKGQSFHFQGQIGTGYGYMHTTYKSCIPSYKFENIVSQNPKASKNQKNPITQEPVETIKDKRDIPTLANSNQPKTIVLKIEENGHYSQKRVFQLALSTFEEKLRVIKNLIYQKDASRLAVKYDPNIDNMVTVELQDPSDQTTRPKTSAPYSPSQELPPDRLASQSLGHLLETHCKLHLQDLIKNRPKNEIQQIIQNSLTSYKYPHPLDKVLLIQLKVPKEVYQKKKLDLSPSLTLLDETIDNLLDTVGKVSQAFK